jgi:decaprenylphospho-beta-D-erythro-pentofuranosid-2-ulose 2-reductase
MLLLERMKEKLKSERFQFVCVISSLAADRGKKRNSVYASTKAGLSCYLEGIEQEFFPYGTVVTIVKPGFVKTKMTSGDAKVQKSIFSQTAGQVAYKIYKAVIKRRYGDVYTSFFFYCVGIALKLMPDFIFRRINI